MFSLKESKHAAARMAEIDNVRGREGQGDGELSSREFCDFMVEYTNYLSDQAFTEKVASWEANVAGSFRKLLLRRVFNRMDVDRSGSISLEEFRI